MGSVVSRSIKFRYEDPLDALWTKTARSLGLTVQRGPHSYASTDGNGVLSLSDPSGMDRDDCLAQMILHEICHWMVQGPQSIGWVDWGLDNVGDTDVEREHACLRLQAALLDPFGLRETLGPTTDFRVYYDALPSDPFSEREAADRESITRARAAWNRRNRRPFGTQLEEALRATKEILDTVAQGDHELSPDSLLATAGEALPLHRFGTPLAAVNLGSRPRQCGDCAWAVPGKKNLGLLRCRQHNLRKLEAHELACVRFEESFDCLACGACCREAYDTVEVAERDPAKKKHLHLMVERSGGHDMKRAGSRCVCLQGGLPLAAPVPAISGGRESADAGQRLAPLAMPGGAPFTCSIYEDRPRTCRDFTIFSQNCLDARRSVGLSR